MEIKRKKCPDCYKRLGGKTIWIAISGIIPCKDGLRGRKYFRCLRCTKKISLSFPLWIKRHKAEEAEEAETETEEKLCTVETLDKK